MTDRACAYPDCGKPLVRRERETEKRFLGREACSRSCADKLRRKGVMRKKTCAAPNCAKRLSQRSHEGAASFARRQTCSRECAGDLAIAKHRERLNDHSAAYWPEVMGEIDWSGGDFHAHNLNIEGGRFVTLPRPLNHSPTGNSASLLVEAAR